MQDFYRKALVRFALLLAFDVLLAGVCIHLGMPSASLMPRSSSGPRWHLEGATDIFYGGASAVRLLDAAPGAIGFVFNLAGKIPYPWASAGLHFDGADGKPAPADLSAYPTLTFVAKCIPANSLILNITTHEDRGGKGAAHATELPAKTYFSCNEKGTPVTLDLTRLAIPGWWYNNAHVTIGHQSYHLDRVVALDFGASEHSARDTDSLVEISELRLQGRDGRYLALLVALLLTGWFGFGIWFFRAQSRALLASLNTRLEKDLTFVAYRQLTIEPVEDAEKARILRCIATRYADPGLDLDAVAAATGAQRNTIGEVLKSELGMTFVGYLKKLRLTEAGRLLTESPDATVAEIAHSVGYANASYFNKLFREEYGCTPKEFRQLATRPAASQE